MAIARRLPMSGNQPFDDDQMGGYRPPNGNTGISGGIPGGLPLPPIMEDPPQEDIPVPSGETPGGGARGGETPRERAGANEPGGTLSAPSPTAPQATPPRPRSPQPVGGVQEVPPPSGVPTSPMPPIGPGDLSRPIAMRGLLGSQGGLTGGGLGVPFDPVANQKSDPISSLIQLLQRRNGGGGY